MIQYKVLAITIIRGVPDIAERIAAERNYTREWSPAMHIIDLLSLYRTGEGTR